MKSIPWDGQRISKPGLYSGIPLEEYHRGDICDGPSISSSGLRMLWRKSPKHFWDASPLNPNRNAEGDESADFVIGRAAHHLICGEIGFSSHYAIRPDKAPDGRDWHGANKSCIKWLDEMAKSGLTVLTPTQAEQIKGMAVELSKNALMQQGILSGLVERSMFWRDPTTNVWLKARPDVISTASGEYADLKTTQSVLYKDTQRSIDEYGYIQQGALILEGARALDLEASSFSLVWVEKKRPHCVRVQTLKDEDIGRGGKMNRAMLDVFHACITAKHWPGPGDDRDDAEYVDLSDVARKRIDDRIQFELREAVS
jgi:hypothetical protein